jgi:hypothetical protein
MKEINKKENCVPQSSNCVSWQGPELCCINLCEGDTISDVNYKMALEICAIKETLNLSDLDISCLLQNCTECNDPIKDVYTVLRLLLQKVCLHSTQISQLSGGTVTVDNTQLLQVASNLVYEDGNGFPVTQLEIAPYVNLIGGKLSETIGDVEELQTVSEDYGERITDLENRDYGTSPVNIQVPDIMGDNNPHTTNEVVIELADQFVELRDVTGTPENLSSGIDQQPDTLASSDALSQGGPMSGYTNWVDNPTTVGDTLTNMWITIQDMRAEVASLKTSTAVNCSDVSINYTVVLSNNGKNASVYFAAYSTIPNGFEDCDSPSIMTVTDSNGGTQEYSFWLVETITANTPLELNLDGTPLNTALDYTFELNGCVTNGTLTCEKQIIKQVENNASLCPEIATVAGSTTISYTMQVDLIDNVNYVLDLFDATTSPASLVATKEHTNPGTTIISDGFSGLTPSNAYYILPKVIPSGGDTETCPQINISTTA